MYIIQEAFEDEDIGIKSCFLFINTKNRIFMTECSGWKAFYWGPCDPDDRCIGRESKHTVLDITTETISLLSDIKRFRDNTKWIGLRILREHERM